MRGPLSVDVAVVGGGPAGSTLAARLTQLGHRVALVEREAFTRPRLGESLTPAVVPLLRLTGADEAVVRAGFPPVDLVLVDWGEGRRDRREEGARGLLVDRRGFDRLLLEHARRLGVTVLQAARVVEHRHDGESWRLRVEPQPLELTASFLGIAGGRSRVLPGRRTSTGPRTLCLHAYWRGPELPRPCIQALEDAWCWGVPLPDGTVDALVFVDPGRVGGNASAAYEELLARSALGAYVACARRVSPVRGADATPYLDTDCISRSAIRVGDAGVSLDPISSTGVQKAIQTALAGAVVVNTILRRPDVAEVASRYYAASLADASARHCSWAAEHYARVAAVRDAPFWTRRAAGFDPISATEPRVTTPPRVDDRLDVSDRVEYVELPCVNGEFVELRTAVAHPGLDEPVAYLGGCELAPLLRRTSGGSTAGELVRAWSGVVAPDQGHAMCEWLARKGILVAQGAEA